MILNLTRYNTALSATLKTGCFLVFLIFLTPYIYAQKLSVSGVILSAEDNQPIIGATVLEKGTGNGTLSDTEGAFKIDVASPNAVLIFTYIGLESIEMPVGGKTTLNVVMSTSNALLKDVIVTGYKKEIRSNISTAIASIKSKDIEKLVVSGVEQALQGQAAGVMVTQVTGAPGDDIAVRIRGAGTLGNNNPLFIVDGLPTTANINMFSVADIESIEVKVADLK